MFMRETLACAVLLAFGIGAASAADAPRFGQPITQADIAPWDISIAPDGAGLPPGSGTPAQGSEVYAAHGCAACHGDKGSGGVGRPAGRRRSAQYSGSRSAKAGRQLLALGACLSIRRISLYTEGRVRFCPWI